MKLSENVELWDELQTEIKELEAYRFVDVVPAGTETFLKFRPGAVGAVVNLALKILDAYQATYKAEEGRQS